MKRFVSHKVDNNDIILSLLSRKAFSFDSAVRLNVFARIQRPTRNENENDDEITVRDQRISINAGINEIKIDAGGAALRAQNRIRNNCR